MNWDFFWNESMYIDDAYLSVLGVFVGDVKECEMLDAFAMVFGMPV